MRWSKLFVPTLREEPAEGDVRWRLFRRAGYVRDRGNLGYLFLGHRTLKKIEAALVSELAALGGQEVDLFGMASILRGELRSYKQLPQVWFRRFATRFQMEAMGLEASVLQSAIERALRTCGVRAVASDPLGDLVPEEFATPDVKTIEELAAFTGRPESSLIKSVVMSMPEADGGGLVLLLMRGDHDLHPALLKEALGAETRWAEPEEIRAVFGAAPGSLGPLGVNGVRIIADDALEGRQNMICGANRDGFHTRNVTWGRDFEAELHHLRVVGQRGTPLVGEDGSEIGWSRQAESIQVLNEAGIEFSPESVEAEVNLEAVLAGVGKADRDERGLVMPPRIAPFTVVVTPVNVNDEAQRSTAEQLYEQAKAAGCDALLDDRDERPGVKFKDAELIGIPWRVTLGKGLAEGKAEVYERASGQKWDVAVGDAVEFVRGRWDLVG